MAVRVFDLAGKRAPLDADTVRDDGRYRIDVSGRRATD